ncbi:hypothetical protein ACJZ2D_004623 [Fusarium nematophilum]
MSDRPYRFKPRAVRRDAAGRQRLAEMEEEKARQRMQDIKEHCEKGWHDGHRKVNCPYLTHSFRQHRNARVNKHRNARVNKHQNARAPPLVSTEPRNKTLLSASTHIPQLQTRAIRLAYDSPGMSELDKEAQGSICNPSYPTPRIRFPYLRHHLSTLLNNLYSNKVRDLQGMDYADQISRWDIDGIIKAAMEQIEPEILDLQGQPLSPEVFLETQAKQFLTARPWPQTAGYVDGVLDRRMPEYIRFYVGQSSRVSTRISIDHVREIRNGSTRHLHYFVLARGHGNRSAHFLRLWSDKNAPNTSNESGSASPEARKRSSLIQNVLEAVFCRAFESLPPQVLNPLFGEGAYSYVGLNILSPLLQGKGVSRTMRAKYLEYHQNSPDTDISAYVEFRKDCNAERRNKLRAAICLLRRDYRQAIKQLASDSSLDPGSFSSFGTPSASGPSAEHDINARFQEVELAISRPLCRPRGNFQARIGVVLSSELAEVEYDGHTFKPLQGLELKENDHLIWTTSFDKIGSEPPRLSQGSNEDKLFGNLNRSIIVKADLRVVVVCGLRAQGDIQRALADQLPAPLELSPPQALVLGNDTHQVWFLTSGRTIQTVLLACPEPIITSYLRNFSLARRLRDVFGLVSTLTGIRLRYICWVNQCFHAAFIAQLAAEKEDPTVPPLTTPTLGAIFQDWLHYRGFKDEADIMELEKAAGGNLTRGIKYVRLILSKRAQAGRRRTVRTANPVSSQGDVTHSDNPGAGPRYYEAIHELFSRLYKERFDSIKSFKRLENDRQPSNSAPPADDEDPAWEDGDINQASDDGAEEDMETNPLAKLRRALSKDDDDDEQDTQRGTFYKKTPRKLELMLSESGVELPAIIKKRTDRCYIDIHQKLVNFTIPAESGVIFGTHPRFRIRAHLNPPGVPHPDRILGHLDEYISTDPCLRLAIQYRLVNDGREGSETQISESHPWHFARIMGSTTSALKRIGRANALVDFFGGKTANDLIGIERRSGLEKWKIWPKQPDLR